MTLLEMLRFDTLRYQQERTVREQVEYEYMLERVKKGADGKSEFPTEPTEIQVAQVQEVMHRQLCDNITKRIMNDLCLYGPKITVDVINALIALTVKKS